MSGRQVAKSKYEANQHHEHRRSFRPGSGEKHEEDGVILYVFDAQNLRVEGAPDYLLAEAARYPGKLYAIIQLSTGRKLIRPFKDPADYIFLVYGDAPLLKGRPVKLVYENGRVDSGLIHMAYAWQSQHTEMPVATETWDIGAAL